MSTQSIGGRAKTSGMMAWIGLALGLALLIAIVGFGALLVSGGEDAAKEAAPVWSEAQMALQIYRAEERWLYEHPHIEAAPATAEQQRAMQLYRAGER